VGGGGGGFAGGGESTLILLFFFFIRLTEMYTVLLYLWAAVFFCKYWPHCDPLRSILVANSSITIKYYRVVLDGVHA